MGGRNRKSRSATKAQPLREPPSHGEPDCVNPAVVGPRGKWTAAGAARAARDARIATAAHLRTAPVAHRWEVTRLVSSYQLWRDHLRAQLQQIDPALAADRERSDDIVGASAATLLFGGSGLTPPYPADLDEGARRMLDLRADDLDAAALYVLSPSMCDVVVAAAQTLTIDDLALLDHDDLASPTGMLLLPHPILVRAVNGNLGDARAYVWTSPACQPGVTETGVPTVLPGVRVTSYLDSHGPVRPDSFRDMASLAAAQGTPLPPLLPDGTRSTAYRAKVTDDVRSTLVTFSAHARANAAKWRAMNSTNGFNEDDQVDSDFEYHPGDEIDDHDDLFTIRFLYAFWRLCGQSIAELDDVPAGHSARLLASRAGVTADVRVATIRPTRRTDTGHPATARDWQHRWVVRMHKVRQWYPSEQRHKVIYRGPYVKGPAEKPLLGGDVVRSMSR